MNQSQIRAVKDCLDPHFKEAKQSLEQRQKAAVDSAVEDEKAKILNKYRAARLLIVDTLLELQATIRTLHREAGIDVASANGIYIERIERFQSSDLKFELSDEMLDELRTQFGAVFASKIDKIEGLKRQTYLTLHDSTTIKLSPLVEKVVAEIQKVLA